MPNNKTLTCDDIENERPKNQRPPEKRRHGEIGYIPPVEAETIFYSNLPTIKTMERV